MKNAFKLIIGLTIAIMAVSCDKEILDPFEETSSLQLTENSVDVPSSPFTENLADNSSFPYTTNLMAGQHHLAGTITVDKDADNLLVTYQTNTDSTSTKSWTIAATHLYVGDCTLIPITKAGNPKIGKFPFKEDHPTGTTSYTYSIPLDTLSDCLCIAAHAVVDCNQKENTPGNNECSQETAWGAGQEFAGNSWAMYIEVCTNTPTPEECSLAIELVDEYDGEGTEIHVNTENEILTYEWSTGDTSSSIYAFPNSTTTYTVTVTDLNGCTTSESLTITIPVQEEECSLAIELVDEYDGEGTEIYVNTENEILTYEWSTGDTSSSIYVFSNGTTTYTVTVTDINGCTTSESITI